jgi:CCR4-NOT transcriptional regulation complex NOT5 subunit
LNSLFDLFKEPDFAEDENIYDDLNLEEEEELWGIANDDHHSSHDSITDGGKIYLHIIITKNSLSNILFI